MTLVVQSYYDLYGPEPRDSQALLRENPQIPSWGFPGAATSASTVTLWFNEPLPSVQFARFACAWNPHGDANSGARLVYMDDGPNNITAVAGCTLTGQTLSTPIWSTIDITAALETLRAARIYKHFGLQMIGQNARVYRASLDISWLVTP